MYKGYKVTKHLQRYMRYAKIKYQKLSMQEEVVDLWEILKEYDFIMQQAKCMQMYIYDWLAGELINREQYIITCAIDGGIYVKKRINRVA